MVAPLRVISVGVWPGWVLRCTQEKRNMAEADEHHGHYFSHIGTAPALAVRGRRGEVNYRFFSPENPEFQSEVSGLVPLFAGSSACVSLSCVTMVLLRGQKKYFS